MSAGTSQMIQCHHIICVTIGYIYWMPLQFEFSWIWYLQEYRLHISYFQEQYAIQHLLESVSSATHSLWESQQLSLHARVPFQLQLVDLGQSYMTLTEYSLRLWVNSWESFRLIGIYFWTPKCFGLRLGLMVTTCRSFNKVHPNVEGELKLCGKVCSSLVFSGLFLRIFLTKLCNKMVTPYSTISRHRSS